MTGKYFDFLQTRRRNFVCFDIGEGRSTLVCSFKCPVLEFVSTRPQVVSYTWKFSLMMVLFETRNISSELWIISHAHKHDYLCEFDAKALERGGRKMVTLALMYETRP